MFVTTMNTPQRSRMTAKRSPTISPLTLLSATLVFSGLIIGALDMRWSLQLVSLGCVYCGALLAGLGLVIHLFRGHLAWAADGGMLAGLATLVLCNPILPATLQDYLEYLMP